MCLILFCSVMEGDMYRIAGIEFDHVVQILRSSAATRSSVCRVMWMFSVTFSSSFNFIAPTKKNKKTTLVKIRAADFSQVKPHTGGRTGCACTHVRSTNWPVVPVEEEPVDPLELVVPEAVAVPVFPRLIPLLPQIGRGPILKGTHFFFPCFEMNNALTFHMKTPNERRATSLGKKDKASCRVQGVKRNTEITVAVVLRMRLQLFLVFDWVTYKLRDLTVCSLGYYTMLLIQPRFLLHGAEVIGFSLFKLWL